MERTVQTPDGRTLAVEDTGDPAGWPVLIHNGTPNSRLIYAPVVADAQARGLRLISYDRPGYGGSSPHPGRTVADCAADVRAICATLGIDRLATWGISGGGPHVLACAALLPDLVVAAASLASPAPLGAQGLDWFAGMGEDNVEDVKVLLKDPVAARGKTETDRQEILMTVGRGARRGPEIAAYPGRCRGPDRRPRRLPGAVEPDGPGARQRGLVGRRLRAERRGLGLRPGEHQRAGAAHARASRQVRALLPRRVAGQRRSRASNSGRSRTTAT